MSNNLNVIKYVKHNNVRLKTGKREEATKVLLEFFKELEEKPTGMMGYVIMDARKIYKNKIAIYFLGNKGRHGFIL